MFNVNKLLEQCKVKMPIKEDEFEVNQEVMLSALIQRPEEDKINKLHDIRRQLAYLKSRKSMIQSRGSEGKSNKEQLEISLKLLKLVADTQLSLTQINGQRRLGPPPGWVGPPPGPKCEIFVGSIPRDFYEPEIVLIFSTVGTIYELRLMMEFSGANRGYCFIMFTTEEEAARAVKELDKYEIYPGKRIGVVASTNNCRIYINQLPRNIGTRTIVKRIYEITEEVEKVCVYRNLKGYVSYVLISYKTHRGAAMGRKRLLPEAATLFKNVEVNIEWANPYISPSNVLEETGTCDENGKLEITKTFIGSVKCKKAIDPPKQRASDASNSRIQSTLNLPVQKGRAIRKCVSENNSSKNSDSTLKVCENQLKSVICSNCCSKLLLDGCKLENFGQPWNRNLSNNVNQLPAYENVKDCSNAILPPISTFLNREKRWKKWDDVNYSERVFRPLNNIQTEKSSSNSRPINGRRFDSSSQCYSDNNSSNSSSLANNDFQSNIWDSIDDLVKVSPVTQPITNGNDGNGYAHGSDMRNNISHLPNNILNSQLSNETNTLPINYQYNYRNWSMNSNEENNRMVYFLYQSSYKSQNARKNIPRHVLSSDINQNDLFPSLDAYQREAAKLLQSNSLNNTGYLNNYHDQNYTTLLNPPSSQFNGRFTNESAANVASPVNLVKDFVDDEGNFRRF